MPEITSIPTELIKIFANAGNPPRRYDDAIALELLKYLQSLASAEKLATPSLDLYLAGKYPAMDLGRHIINVLRDRLDAPELEKPDVGQMSAEEYREACANIFPRVVLDIYPTPSETLDPYANLFPVWTLELKEKVAEEVWYGSEKLRNTFFMIREYIFLCANNWPEGSAYWFFTMWNGYLLNHQWSDRIAELEAALQEERDYSHAADVMLAKQSQRIAALHAAAEEHYITLTDAAKRALEVEFGRHYEEKDLKALTMRLSRQLEGVESLQPRKRRHKYFRVDDVLNALENDPEIKATAEQLRIQILDAGVPRSEIS